MGSASQSKPATIGTIALVGATAGIGIFYSIWLNKITEENKKIEDLLEKKQEFLADTYGPAIVPYLKICREEIKKTTEEDLSLSLKFLKAYFCLVDLMTAESIETQRKLTHADRIRALKKFDFSTQTKLQNQFVDKKISLIIDAQDVLNDVLQIPHEQLMASKIWIIRQAPHKYIEIFLKGPDTRNRRIVKHAPEDLQKKFEILEFLKRTIEARTDRGFNSVDTSKFSSFFEEYLIDELVARFGLNWDQFFGICLRVLRAEGVLEGGWEDEEVHGEGDGEDQDDENGMMVVESGEGKSGAVDLDFGSWAAGDERLGEFGKKLDEVMRLYVDMMKLMYRQMTIFEPGVRIDLKKVERSQL